ncbi:MAG: ABC transporter ATP-binding protein, partial [bacterium]|nr:ABC transporter ATP-binding protein [bacterium]
MTNRPPKKMKETERISGQMGPGRGPHSGGMVGQKSQDFRDSGKRLLNQLRPERLRITAIFIAAIVGVGFTAIGPRVLGRATDIVFAGAIGKQLPSGATKEQVIEMARSQGDEQVADLLTGVDVVPGQGIDFSQLGGVLLLVLALYAMASLLRFLQGYLLTGVVQNTLRRMRNDVEDKLNRMPLSYFDRQPRGELLSRVTNDLDNVSQTLQQTMSQLLASLLTIVFMFAMMVWLSWTLALITLVTIPVSMAAAGIVMKRSQVKFIDQWRRTGALNAQVEEAFSGHSLVKVFGRQRE